MGYLIDEGKTLQYKESKQHIPAITRDSITQFLHLYKKNKDLDAPCDFWGDELEYHIVNLDPTTGKVRIQLNAADALKRIQSSKFVLEPEYGRWMIEAVPKDPYDVVCDPTPVLHNMIARREDLQKVLNADDFVLSIPVYPLLGVGDFYTFSRYTPDSEMPHKDVAVKEEKKEKEVEEMSKGLETFLQKSYSSDEKVWKNDYTRSRMLDDEIINPHPRYLTVTRNARERSGRRACSKIPIYKDKNTSFEKTDEEPFPGYIHLDALAFGIGSCCLQQTFATRNVSEARYLTDQLAVIAPLMLVLSAASPIFKGKIADTDTRWQSESELIDCRTEEERDPESRLYIARPRYDVISYYISDDKACKDEYNDVHFRVNGEAIKQAVEIGAQMGIQLDDRLLKHIGFLYVREPLIIFEDKIKVDNEKNSNHFENIQSTNWNSVRFKPPPCDDNKIGWRVELRTSETQMRDVEMAALDLFALLVVRMVQKFRLNFYIPMSKMHENFARAQKRDAILTEKFWFRKSLEYGSTDEYVELTMLEILKGKDNEFKGLLAWAEELLESDNDCKENSFIKAKDKYLLEILVNRAAGKLPTNARWMREFVLSHPKYKQDSVVSEEVGHDLLRAILQIANGTKSYDDFAKKEVAVFN